MLVKIKTAEELALMRESGRLLAQVFAMLDDYVKAGSGMKLEEGMTFTIEPMINQGDHRLKHMKDGWTVITRDKKLSAQWEHTIAVTATGYEVLTLRDEEKTAAI